MHIGPGKRVPSHTNYPNPEGAKLGGVCNFRMASTLVNLFVFAGPMQCPQHPGSVLLCWSPGLCIESALECVHVCVCLLARACVPSHSLLSISLFSLAVLSRATPRAAATASSQGEEKVSMPARPSRAVDSGTSEGKTPMGDTN